MCFEDGLYLFESCNDKREYIKFNGINHLQHVAHKRGQYPVAINILHNLSDLSTSRPLQHRCHSPGIRPFSGCCSVFSLDFSTWPTLHTAPPMLKTNLFSSPEGGLSFLVLLNHMTCSGQWSVSAGGVCQLQTELLGASACPAMLLLPHADASLSHSDGGCFSPWVLEWGDSV